MNRFEYIRPDSVAGAVAAAAQDGTAFLAGGTNLLDLMKGNVSRPERVVDISRLPGLDRIEITADGGMRIGALVRNSDLAYHPEIDKRFPAVAEALLSGASAQLRNAATVGGNVMQRTRCPYFYDPANPCNKRAPGSGCGARGGETRNMAVLGWSEDCIAIHPSDFCVPMAALDAAVEIAGPAGTREVPLEDFHLLPGGTPERETVMAPGEMIVALRLPPQAAGFAGHTRYLKLRDRTSYAFAIVSAAAALRLAGETIAEARLALGGVALKPWRAREAEQLLAGQPIGEAAFARAADAALSGAKPSGENGFKIELARRLVIRALRQAAQGTPRPLPALPGSVVNLA
jgi:xanthine dehydrogenase YagS FAD-binding subunit